MITVQLQERTDAALEGQKLPLEEGVMISQAVASQVLTPDTSGHTSTVWRVMLADGHRGYFKAQDSSLIAAQFGHDPDEVFLNDCAAWRLASALGAPFSQLLPPCVVRTIGGETGSLIAHRSKSDDWIEIEELYETQTAQCAAAAFFDSLIGQQDRHDGNYRYDVTSGRLSLTDHGFSFPGGTDLNQWRFNASFFVEQRHLRGESALSESEVAALEFLTRSPAFANLHELLGADRSARLIERAHTMLNDGAILALGQW